MSFSLEEALPDSLRAVLVQRVNISFVCSLVYIRRETESLVLFIHDTMRCEEGDVEGQCSFSTFTQASNKLTVSLIVCLLLIQRTVYINYI